MNDDPKIPPPPPDSAIAKLLDAMAARGAGHLPKVDGPGFAGLRKPLMVLHLTIGDDGGIDTRFTWDQDQEPDTEWALAHLAFLVASAREAAKSACYRIGGTHLMGAKLWGMVDRQADLLADQAESTKGPLPFPGAKG